MKKVYFFIVFLFVILSLVSIYQYIPKEENFARNADEGHYFSYSERISKSGLKIYPVLFEEYVKNKENWIWPSPLRLGYFLVSSTWFKITYVSLKSLANLSFVFFVIFLLISFYFSKRYFGKLTASLFVLLLVFSPLSMAMAKRALTDSMGGMFIGLSIWLFLYFLSEKKMYAFFIFVFFYCYTILIREQAILLICFFGLFFLIYKYLYKKSISEFYFPLIFIIPVFVVGSALLYSSQSVSNLISVIQLNRILPKVNEYSVLFCRGPWFRYILDYVLVSPLTTVLALSFIVYVLVEREILKDYKIGYFFVLFLILYFLLSIFDYNKNIRYAAGLDMIMRLFVVLMLTEMFKRSRHPGDYIFLSILFLCFVDYFNFMYLFCQKDIYDPISFMLLKAWRFIP